MNRVTCDVIKDLIPLVEDGVASEDSIKLVKEHLSHCEKCKSLNELDLNVEIDENQIMHKLKKKINACLLFILIIGIIFGLTLTATVDMFNNIIIMPIIGFITYYLFNWKSLFIGPLFVFVLNVVFELVKLLLGLEFIGFIDMMVWPFIYSIFVIVGILIGGLIKYAFSE